MLHPDLGIGGAERLVVDAAVALQRAGHTVHVYTSHHDRSHCFAETRDGTVAVTVYGDWLPRHIFGYFHAVCAYLRMVYLSVVVLCCTSGWHVFFCDQVSVCVPILRLGSARVLFYCHFPDQLLAKKTSRLKDLYRAPLNWLEEKTTGMAHGVMVNSIFTAGVFKDTFTTLSVTPAVLYPSLDFTAFDIDTTGVEIEAPKSASIVFLSINRYERKKNLMLALQALAELRRLLQRQHEEDRWKSIHLVMAGGYDTRVQENVEYHSELADFARQENLSDHVTFIRSFSDVEKVELLKRCSCLLYTPENEHFGITPLEAMYCSRPVIAVDSGGPLETIAGGPGTANSNDAQTGLLCESTPLAFAQAMLKWCDGGSEVAPFGPNGRERVISKFSFTAFQTQLDQTIRDAVQKK